MGEIADMCQGVADLIAEGRLEAERQALEEKRRAEETERRVEEEKREAERGLQEEKQRADKAIGLLKTAARNLAVDSSSRTTARIGELLGQPEEQIGEWLASSD